MTWPQVVHDCVFYIAVAVCVFAFFRYVIGGKE
jgi:hypothetical protein